MAGSRQPSVVVVMNGSLAAVAELVPLLDNGGALARFALPDHGGAVMIALAIRRRLADSHAGAHGANAHADIIGESRRCDCTHDGRCQKIRPHVSPPPDARCDEGTSTATNCSCFRMLQMLAGMQEQKHWNSLNGCSPPWQNDHVPRVE